MTSGCGVTVLVDAEGKPLVTPLSENDEIAMDQLLNR